MPRKKIALETVAVTPVRAAKPKTRTEPTKTAVVETASKPRAVARVKSVKHSKAVSAPVTEIQATQTPTLSVHDQIAIIAYGYWAARGFQAGSPEQDWLRAEQEFLSA